MKLSDSRGTIIEVRHGAAAATGITHPGLRRSSNEDRFLINALPDGSLLAVVADGLGIGGAGDRAAEMIMERFEDLTHIPNNHEQLELRRIACELDHAVHHKSLQEPGLDGMGSTLIGVLLRAGRLYWAHVGDSRLYLFRNNHLTQVTKDQTLARFLLAEGEITPEELPGHYSRNVMDQYIGCGYCEPETGCLVLNNGDLLMLSTDGLHQSVSKAALAAVCGSGARLQAKSEMMVAASIAAGGPDNITAVLMTQKQG